MKYTTAEDSMLVKAYIRGNEEAFTSLVNRHKDKAFTTIYIIVKDKDLANDILQDTFIKAIHTLKSGKYNEEGKFAPWLMRIAHNLSIDHFRKAKRYPHHTLEERGNIDNDLNFSEASIENDKIQKDNINKLKVLIERLPKNQREVLQMRHYAGMSFKDIAEATNVSINTALGRMRYALINLKKEMIDSDIILDFQ